MGADRVSLVLDMNIAAGTDEDRYVGVPSGQWLLKGVQYVPATAVSANDTNNVTLTVNNGSDAVASRQTDVAGGAFVEGTPVSLSLTAGKRLEFVGGTDAINVDVFTTGSGAVADGAFLFEMEKQSADA